MPEPAERWSLAVRASVFAAVAIITAWTLMTADPIAARPVTVGLGLLAAIAIGRAARAAGVPGPLGDLLGGAIVGPSASMLVASVVPRWPFVRGLVDPSSNTARDLAVGATALAMMWVGRRAADRGELRELGAVGAVFLGHVAAALALALAIAAGVETALIAGSGTGLLERVEDTATLAAALMGTSVLITASVLADTRAQGPATRVILKLALLGEITGLLAVVAWTEAASFADMSLLLVDSGPPARLLSTVALGTLTGVLLAVGGRWVPDGRGIWNAAVIVIAAAVAASAGVPVSVLAVVAGLVAASLDVDAEPDLVDTLAPPALTVALVLAGAAVPLPALAAGLPVGLGLVAVRLTVLVATGVGIARLFGAPPMLARWGWTGLVASALPVSGLVTWYSVDPGLGPNKLAVVLWGVAAIDGVLGAVAVGAAVRAAGETPDTSPIVIDTPDPGVWLPDDSLPPGRLRDQVEELVGDLQAMARDLKSGPLGELRGLEEDLLDGLRREHRRFHRRVSALLTADDGLPAEAVRRATVDMADRWRSHLLDHAARMGRSPWDPAKLVQALDRVAESNPEQIEVPWEHDTALASLVGAQVRSIPLRHLLRYHLSGHMPGRLEPVASRLVNLELDLAGHVRHLFLRMTEGYLAMAEGDPTEERLDRLDIDLRADLDTARAEVRAGLDDAVHRFEAALRRTIHELLADLQVINTFDLPPRARDARHVEAERRASLTTLTTDLAAARETCRARFDALSLEVELSALELEVQGALDDHGAQVARRIRGQGATQLARVDDALRDAEAAVEQALDKPATGEALARTLREAAARVSRTTNDAVATAEELREELAGQTVIEPLLEALTRVARGLTEVYRIPVGSPREARWALPEDVHTAEINFRETVLTYVETSVTRDLLSLTQRYALELSRLIEGIEETDRAVGFNVELAAAELLFAPSTEVDAERRLAVRGVLVDGLVRAREGLSGLRSTAASWFDDVDTRLQAAALDGLEGLRIDLSNGDMTRVETAMRTSRAARARDRQVAAAEDIQTRIRRLTREQLGEDRAMALRRFLGVSAPAGDEEHFHPRHFAPPEPRITIPSVYRRLFSDLALDAGELLAGRQAQADKVRAALVQSEGDVLRAVAVVGPPGAGQGAVVRAALRALKIRGVHRLELTAPVDPHEVDTWFDRGTHGHVYVLSGFDHLYTLTPGGAAPLQRFVAQVVADRGRNAWVIQATDPVWSFARDLAPLDKAFPSVVHLDPLDWQALKDAVLARHRMSGFGLHYEALPEGAEPKRVARFEQAWFKEFHEVAGGVARDAMHLWLASLVEVDVHRERVVVGDVPPLALPAMRHVTPVTAAVLRATARQGWIDATTCASLFDESLPEAEARLSHLAHWGLLERHDIRYRMPDHLHRVLRQILAERGWA